MEARRLEGRVAAVSGEQFSESQTVNGDDECRAVMDEAITWLEGFSLDSVSEYPLLLSFNA